MTSPLLNCKTALTAIAAACLLSACGGSSSGSFGDQPQEETTSAYSGSVIDGYVSDATVCIDANANNACDANEVFTKTDQLGAYSVLPTASGNLVAVGGTNKDTMKPNELILSTLSTLDYGTSSIRQITPLTTMAALLKQEADKSESTSGQVKSSELAALIKEGFGLIGNFDLFRFDPIARANDMALVDADRDLALNVHRVGVQVANTVITSMALDNDKLPTSQTKKFIVFFALALQKNEDPDLTSETQLRKLLFAGSNVEPSDAQVTRLAESNARVQAAATPVAIGLEQNDYLNKLATNPGGETTPPDNGGGDGSGDGDNGSGDNGGFNPADLLSPTVLCNIPVLGPILVNNVLALVLAPIPVPGFDDLSCDEGTGGGFEFPSIPGIPGAGDGGFPSIPGLPGGDGAPSLPGLPGADAASPLTALLSGILAPVVNGLSTGLCLIPVLGEQLINVLAALPVIIPNASFSCPEGDGGGFSFPGLG